MTKTFTIELKMTSDWHIGSGQGQGVIDSLVQRDRNKLPYIPAKTLTGILRDGCELVALGLDNGQENGLWQEWVNCLFGEQPAIATNPIENTPRPAALSIRSAHLPETLKKALIDKPKLQEAIAFIKPGISIDPVSGCAITNFLRFEEMIRQGATLKAENCSLTLPPNSSQDEEKTAIALLIAGAKIVERLGGKRRRGAGECEITIKKDFQTDLKENLQWLQQQDNPVSPSEFAESEELKESLLHSAKAQDGDWHSLQLRIRTKSPIILASRTVGNVVETLDYISGKYLLRSLHKKLGKSINLSEAISNGDLIVTNATPSVNNQPSRPVPFCLFAEKLNGGLDKGKVYNRLVEGEPEGEQLKGIREGYLGNLGNGKLPAHLTVERHIYTHNTIEDKYQRPTSDVGGVYSYESIPEGTEFYAELRLKKGLVEQLKKGNQKWYEALKGKYCIGQSKKDDYGVIEIEVPSRSQQLPSTITLQDSTLTVWLLADVLLRNERLRPTADLNVFKGELEKALGVTLGEKKEGEKISLSVRQRRTDSWQVRWGLSRPSLVGLQAGSCLVYEVKGSLDAARLARAQWEGIGERRAEGYGQICFNDPLLTAALSNLKPADKNQNNSSSSGIKPLSSTDEAFNYARLIEREAWRKEIAKQAVALAADEKNRKEILGIEIKGEESKPPMSQLGSFRSVIKQLQRESDNTQITNWIDNLKKVSNRKEKWAEGSLDKIGSLITNQDQVWKDLNLDGQLNDLTVTQNGGENLKSELWAEAVRTLVDACIRAHKRDWEKVADQTT